MSVDDLVKDLELLVKAMKATGHMGCACLLEYKVQQFKQEGQK